MAKKYGLFLLVVALLIVVVQNLSTADANGSVDISPNETGVVAKTRGEDFTVSITFQNTGKDEDIWTVNVVFEGATWSWKGNQKTLVLKENQKETLVWKGSIPANAEINSVARLVVYYGDSFKALDWWIRVVAGSELTIKNSSVS